MSARVVLSSFVALAACAGASRPARDPRVASPETSSSSASTSSSSAHVGAPPLADLLLPSMDGGHPADPLAGLPPREERPRCGANEDCWSATCCPATDAAQCVHHLLAQRCGIVDVTCPPLAAHVDCVREGGECTGRTSP